MPKRKMNERVSCNIKVIVRLTLISLWGDTCQTQEGFREAQPPHSLTTHISAANVKYISAPRFCMPERRQCPSHPSSWHKRVWFFFSFPDRPIGQRISHMVENEWRVWNTQPARGAPHHSSPARLCQRDRASPLTPNEVALIQGHVTFS